MQAKKTRLANGTEKQTNWNAIDWRKANRTVRNLRHRIFRATQEGNQKKVRSLQKLMLKTSVQDVQKKLKDQWDKAQGTNVQSVLSKLNPIIRGWANYFRTAVAKEIFSKLDSWMFYKADRYTRRTHPKKPKDWRHRKYWGRFHLDRLDPWVFGDKQT